MSEVKNEIIPQTAAALSNQAVILEDLNELEKNKDTLLEEFAEQHFSIHKNMVREHVYNRDLSNYLRHILPYFKGKSLSDIKPIDIESWQNRLVSKYKPSSVQKYRSIFYGIFTRAVKNDLIDKNPMDRVTAPKVKDKFLKVQDESINPYTKRELEILTKDDETYMPNFIKLMVSSGIRPGEVIALTWKDVDFEKRQINIDKTILNGKVGLPKTPSSVRKVDMLPDAYSALKAQYEATSEDEYVFVSSKGKRFYSHDVVNMNLTRRQKLYGLPLKPLYQLRHTFTTNMIAASVDLTWVSKMLGHRDVAITLEVYTRFIQEDEDVRLEKLEKISKQLAS